MQVSVQTRLDLSGGNHRFDHLFHDYAELMNKVERTIHAKLKAGREWRGDLAISLYKEFGISAKLIESAYFSLQGKLQSASELAKLHATELGDKIKAKESQIEKKTKKRKKNRQDLSKALLKFDGCMAKSKVLKDELDIAKLDKRIKTLQRYKSELGKLHGLRKKISELRHNIFQLGADLHQHKRRLETLRHKLKKAFARIKNPSICFGSKALFKAQFNLEKNGFASHKEWRAAWVEARNSTFIIEGLASAEFGNEYARLKPREDGLFDLELRLPEALKQHATKVKKVRKRDVYLTAIEGLSFTHNVDLLRESLIEETSVAVRFKHDDKGWRVYASFKVNHNEAAEDYSCGAIGVDLNAGFVSVARTDRFGNVVETFDIPMVTYGKSQGQSATIIKQVVVQIVEYAKRHNLPIVSESLDFAKKKRTLCDENPSYARMLSSFVYSSFDTALVSACARHTVFHRRVNPAYTSIIGRTKFASRYGLSIHAAAALVIARRAMKLSEKLPLSFKERVVTLPLNDAHHATLELPVRKKPGEQGVGTRHVWSDWNEVNKTLRRALAARRPSRRKRRRSIPVVGRNDLHSMVCRSRRDVLESSSESSGPRVGPGAMVSTVKR
ncbi:IS200/IS605 family element transposase accessory protein TnpB [Rhizobium sp. MHM7A]|uniref:IS200/IS605 family element transposase accessory protein TnpB n=1 Tax=Rhizobium sp. MHM7A TaxID=2583233 RepID=UPI0011068D81|nr:IS200/IS605 family element transposase accessory protein TnpB [Rhizobium sp. MHM7A]TLX16139.1 IS200/IS605 family element transposase accessory protein TnpB [Rhizobium sp. MHM7A]